MKVLMFDSFIISVNKDYLYELKIHLHGSLLVEFFSMRDLLNCDHVFCLQVIGYRQIVQVHGFLFNSWQTS